VLGDPLKLEADAIDHMIDLNARAPNHAAILAARGMRDNGRINVPLAAGRCGTFFRPANNL
jgi:cyclic-di-GMP-binding biofilm dispersal mediator protein